jgi:hypothetical protein
MDREIVYLKNLIGEGLAALADCNLRNREISG